MIYEHQLAHGLPCKVLVIEPRRVAAHNLWEYVSKSLPEGEVGLRLGYQQPINPNASISYATAGYVFRKYGSNLSALLEFTHILVDEVHERSIDYDLILLMMKMYLRGGGEIDAGQGGVRRKLILMSATPNLRLYEDYFSYDSLHSTRNPMSLTPADAINAPAPSNLNSIDGK
jgi:HrpA-like RNA helicase